MTLDTSSAYDFILLALAIWREARGQTVAAKIGVAWTIRNRVARPSWWGRSYNSVILCRDQFSSFNPGDPNATKFPMPADQSWIDSLTAASEVYSDLATISDDPTQGATSYFDKSLDANPPYWATNGSNEHTVDIDSLHFFRLAA